MPLDEISVSSIDQLEKKLRKTLSKGYDDLSEIIKKIIKEKTLNKDDSSEMTHFT